MQARRVASGPERPQPGAWGPAIPVLRRPAILGGRPRFSTVLHGSLRFSTVLYGSLPFSTVLASSLRFSPVLRSFPAVSPWWPMKVGFCKADFPFPISKCRLRWPCADANWNLATRAAQRSAASQSRIVNLPPLFGCQGLQARTQGASPPLHRAPGHARAIVSPYRVRPS